MANKKVTRRALTMSIISLILCCAMLVGTTFAWFTDEVKSGMNNIQAGNLDIELYAGDTKVDSTTTLFDNVELWEPGVVAYENLQIANEGTLALKYQMTLNFDNENNLNGHKLSEVLQVVIIDKIADNATREQVLAAAEAKIAEDGKDASLSNFYVTGMLAPKDQTMTVGTETITDKSAEQTVVIFWAPNDAATDNLYNANNGQVTSDEKPLHIEFGINLQATQQMNEKDSFGPDYDESASILPKATVNNVSAKYPEVTATYGIGGAAEKIPMNFALQFLPNEKPEDVETSDYRYWHADYVIKADDVVPANSMALAGYYEAWCSLNNDNWVALTSDQDIAANTEIRLVELLGRTVNYEEICQYADGTEGFLCGAADLTGVNAGTTITVELRMYETYPEGECPEDHGGHMSKNCETGVYKVIGTYSYTFSGASTYVEDVAGLENALSNAAPGSAIYMAPDVDYGTVTLGSDLKDVTIVGADDSTIIVTTDANTKLENVTLKNIAFKYTGDTADCGLVVNENATIKNLVLENCTVTGTGVKAGRGLSGFNNNASIVMRNCTFKDLGYPIYAWGGYESLVIDSCTFDNILSWAIMPQSGFDGDLTVTNCKFVNCLGGGLIKAGTLTAGHTFTFTNNTITGCTVSGDHNWFQFNVSAGTAVIEGNTKEGAAWTPDAADGLTK